MKPDQYHSRSNLLRLELARIDGGLAELRRGEKYGIKAVGELVDELLRQREGVFKDYRQLDREYTKQLLPSVTGKGPRGAAKPKRKR